MTVVIVKRGSAELSVRQQMIERAAALLAKKGLQGTSFSEVLEASGAPRGSLYHHFPGGKDELVLAAVSAVGSQMAEALESLSGSTAGEVARGFAQLWRGVLDRSECTAGCAIVAVTIAAESPVLLDRVGEVFRGNWLRLARLLSEGGVPEGRASALAATLIAACEGAVILSRSQRSIEPFELVAAEQVEAVDAAVAKRRRSRPRTARAAR